MAIVVTILIGLVVLWAFTRTPSRPPRRIAVHMLPERFIVFDLETTGLRPETHEIIEIGAIRVNRDSDMHETFQTLVKSRKRVPRRITELTGISDEMVRAEGIELVEALSEFRKFVGDLPMVAFNASFDEGFLRAACQSISHDEFGNEICCALELSRQAWPDRDSYRLVDIARDGNLDLNDTHRALGDCRRTMIIYMSAASEVGSYR